ncbi:uncharacterized protein HaLaN_30451, partial [Haematococcus lacustris]
MWHACDLDAALWPGLGLLASRGLLLLGTGLGGATAAGPAAAGQRASLASELERVKQDNEFMEGEISTLRATVTEQMQQSTTLKEELSAKKADVGHLTQSCSDQKLQIEHLSRDMQAVLTQLHDTQALLQQAQADRRHQEQE